MDKFDELAVIKILSDKVKQGRSIHDTIKQICITLPKLLKVSDKCSARIILGDFEYRSVDFKFYEFSKIKTFTTKQYGQSSIEIYEVEVSNLITENFLNELKNFIKSYVDSSIEVEDNNEELNINPSNKLLGNYFSRKKNERDIYHDLMPYKAKEILLVASVYDSYIIEQEGRFTERILGEYHNLNLTSIPRITSVLSLEDAFAELKKKNFDMVLLMISVNNDIPTQQCKTIKKRFPYIPIYILFNNRKNVPFEIKNADVYPYVDNVFVWNGYSQIFFIIVKLLEDRVNLKNDTEYGLVRVILLVEDSPEYYSKYLPMLYRIVLEQTRRLIEEVNTDDLYKVLKYRARPKILLVSEYNEAVDIINKYQDNLLCVISDVSFFKDGVVSENAGIELVNKVHEKLNIPTILQSSDNKNAKNAEEIGSLFINKNSESLISDLENCIVDFLGFGHFVYRDDEGKEFGVAKSLVEFEKYLKIVPEESLLYHALKNHFSLWLMARGEIQLAKIINPVKASDFQTANDMRNYLLHILSENKKQKYKGEVVDFEETALLEEENIVSLASGSLGGKGRGLAFVNTLISNFNFHEIQPQINIRTPKTSVIGTDEFNEFIELNDIRTKVNGKDDYQEIKKIFLRGRLSENLISNLRTYLKYVNKPIAVRSSSIFEDSLYQPFSGVFETYFLPNNTDPLDKLNQLINAIKLVYASIYSPDSRMYFDTIGYKIEDEKMAVILQEMVGNQYESYYYPHISGVAQSHNYYPISHMKPDDGIALTAVGLGKYVVDGEKSYRFSPKHPNIQYGTAKELFKKSQVEFYALDMSLTDVDLTKGEDASLIKLNIFKSEKHGTLKHLASVYDVDNERISSGLDGYGPRVVDFANILQYDYIPLSNTIQLVLDTIKDALGTPVEIEFAVDLDKTKNNLPSFYLLQIKPLLGSQANYCIDFASIENSDTILLSNQCMGNGKIDDIYDIIYIDNDKFDNLNTLEMVSEIEELNKVMVEENRKYVLVGPGRWGSKDRFIGVPVVWSQISNAKVIVEVELDDFVLEASLGSHFFHNVTSMNVGYFTIQNNSNDVNNLGDDKGRSINNETKYFNHLRFDNPLNIQIDGKKGVGIVCS